MASVYRSRSRSLDLVEPPTEAIVLADVVQPLPVRGQEVLQLLVEICPWSLIWTRVPEGWMQGVLYILLHRTIAENDKNVHSNSQFFGHQPQVFHHAA